MFIVDDYLSAPFDKMLAQHVKGRCLHTYTELLKPYGVQLINHLPLFNFLDVPRFGRWDSQLGWLYFVLDERFATLKEDHLAVSAWLRNSQCY